MAHKSKPKVETFTGEAAWAAFEKKIKEVSRGLIPQQPFLYGYMYILDRECAAKQNILIQTDLTDKQKDLISKFVGLPFSGHKTYLMLLRKRLAEKFPAIEQRLEKMTWDEILVYVWDTGREKESPPKADSTCDHSHDFHLVTWLGQSYTFNPTQAKIIKLLWNDEKLHQSTIAAAINTSTDKYRLINSFRQHGKYHLAWQNKMIKHLGQGVYTLAKPESHTP